ncbi:MAG: hypothetical protein ACO1N9_12520 [Flavobacterium sp.]
MKKKNYLMLAVAVAMAACSEDDAMPVTTADNQQELVKEEWYFPSAANFTSRNVKYYEDGNIVADSTFSNSGSLINTSAHTYTATSHSWITQGPQGQPAGGTSFIYDAQGRLIEYVFGVTKKFTYNGNTITAKQLNEQTQQYEVIQHFVTDSQGRIIQVDHMDFDFPVTEYITYNNGYISGYQWESSTGVITNGLSYTYYNVSGAPQSPSISFVNREILRLGSVAFVPQQAYPNIKEILSGGQPNFEAQSIFNNNGFILSQKTYTETGDPSGETYYTYQ